MTQRELEQRLTARYRPDLDEAAPAALRAEVAAIPDVIPSAGWNVGGFGARRQLILFIVAFLLVAVAIGGAVAVGSGLVRLPWQHSPHINPAAIDPCSVVSGGVSRTVALDDQGRIPVMGGTLVVDFEGWVNDTYPTGLLTSVGGPACYFLLPPQASRSDDGVLQFRAQETTIGEAQTLAAALFARGPGPFASGPVADEIDGHPAWVGILTERPSVWGGGSQTMAVALSAEPYFFVVTFNPDESILALSDAASVIWWDTYWEATFWPSIRAAVTDVLAGLTRLERKAAP